MDDLLPLRKKLKEWEATFEKQTGRKPTQQDIARRPVLASEYKLYHRLSKQAKSSLQTPLPTPQSTSNPVSAKAPKSDSIQNDFLERILSPKSLQRRHKPTHVPDATASNPPPQDANAHDSHVTTNSYSQAHETNINTFSPVSKPNTESSPVDIISPDKPLIRPGQFVLGGAQSPFSSLANKVTPLVFSKDTTIADNILTAITSERDIEKACSNQAAVDNTFEFAQADSRQGHRGIAPEDDDDAQQGKDDILDEFLRKSAMKIKRSRPTNQIYEAIASNTPKKQKSSRVMHEASDQCSSTKSSDEFKIVMEKNQTKNIGALRGNYVRANLTGPKTSFSPKNRFKRFQKMKFAPAKSQSYIPLSIVGQSLDDCDTFASFDDLENTAVDVDSANQHTRDPVTLNSDIDVNMVLGMFGYADFRTGQKEAITKILEGKSTLLQLPTGVGKSLCYQIPAYVFTGITIVVSPLISLMHDQVNRLPSFLQGVCISSSTTQGEISQIIRNAASKSVKIIFVSPERLTTPSFVELVKRLPPINLVCIDEAHCLSEWSHNFRTSYLRLPTFIKERLGVSLVLALTATATKKTMESIAHNLDIHKDNILRYGVIRPNLHIRIVQHTNSKKEKLMEILTTPEFVASPPMIVYCMRQFTCDDVVKYLQDNGFQAASYHSGKSPKDRTYAQRMFMSNKIPILVATIAFGMGIDKQDIRGIIHYDMPRSLENYIQEIGRSGRDNMPSFCYTIMSSHDFIDLHSLSHSDMIDYFQVEKLVKYIFEQEKSADQLSAISISEVENSFGIKPEVLSTILCLMEAETCISIVSCDYSVYQLSFYKTHPDQFIEKDKIMAALLSSSKKTTKSYVFEIIKGSYKACVDIQEVRQHLRALQSKHEIKLETSNQSHFIRLGKTTQSHLEISEWLHSKLQNIESVAINKLNACFSILSKFVSTERLSPIPIEEGESTIWNDLSEYFNSEQNEAFPTPDFVFEEDKFLESDLRVFISQNVEILESGRSVARIFHGLPSPKFPAQDWNRSQFWGKYRATPFERIVELSVDSIAECRRRKAGDIMGLGKTLDDTTPDE